jgi:type I restriction enzyme S subunit
VALGKMLDAKRVTGQSSGRYLRNTDVQRDAVNTEGLPEMDFAPSERDRYLLRPGDLLVCEGGEVGRTATWRGDIEECFYQKAIHRVRPHSGREVPRFFYYMMLGLAKCGVFVAGGNPNTIDHLTAVQLRHYRVPFAPAQEQRAITAFLDRETARIDALVAKKERLIALLREKRAAVVSAVVTGKLQVVQERGHDKDEGGMRKDETGTSALILQPSSFPMKDSGVEWLGEIPTHWEVKRIRDLAEALQTGPFGSQLHANEYVLGGYPVINPADLSNGGLVPDEECTVDDATADRLAHHRIRDGDILFARRGELGRCGLVTEREQGWLCGTGCLRLSVRLGVARPDFLIRLLSTSGAADWLTLQSVGATMQNLNTSIIGRIPVVVPPVADQEMIATFLDREIARIDTLVAKVRDAIDRLKELRTALISAAVTGKIDVREG